MDFQVEWIKNSVGICAHIDEYEEPIKIEMFKNLENQYNTFSEQERNKIKKIFDSQFENEDLVYVFSIFVSYMDIKDINEYAIDLIIAGNYDALQSGMLEFEVIRFIPGCYEKKRLLHKKNIEQYESILNTDYKYLDVKNRNKNRIVIITEQILTTLHAPTRQVLNYAYAMQEFLGYEVLIFACPSDGIILKDLWYDGQVIKNTPIFNDYKMEITYREATFSGYQIGMTKACYKEYNMMLDIIHLFNPLFVFNLGVVNPIADLAGRFTTLVAKAMSTLVPVSEAKYFLKVGENSEVASYEICKNQKQILIEKIPTLFEDTNNIITREELGLPDDKFIIAIVGNRLKEEVDSEFLSLIKKIIDNSDLAYFVVIGMGDEIFTDEAFEGRIRSLGYCEDLIATYNTIDLYLNPKRQGGGHSSAMALLKGVPVVTFANCDVAFNAGKQFEVSDYDEMLRDVCKHISDKDYHDQKKQMAIEVGAFNTEEKLVNGVKNMLDKITQHIICDTEE